MTAAYPPPRRVLMCSPDAFDVAYAINPHMLAADGSLNRVDRPRARSQWEALRRTYESLGFPVDVVPAQPGLPDMVFAANQSLCGRRGDGAPGALMSNMNAPERRAEVDFFRQFLCRRGCVVGDVPREAVGSQEGNGDFLWHPGRRHLHAGFGPRTTRAAVDAVAAWFDVPVTAYELANPVFYHLDTALAPLDERRALVAAAAFTADGLAAVRRAFPGAIVVPEADAAVAFACNAHCPDGRNVIIDQTATATVRLLESAGFRVHLVDTSEFRKAGGSVFCLKQMYDDVGVDMNHAKATP